MGVGVGRGGGAVAARLVVPVPVRRRGDDRGQRLPGRSGQSGRRAFGPDAGRSAGGERSPARGAGVLFPRSRALRFGTRGLADHELAAASGLRRAADGLVAADDARRFSRGGGGPVVRAAPGGVRGRPCARLPRRRAVPVFLAGVPERVPGRGPLGGAGAHRRPGVPRAGAAGEGDRAGGAAGAGRAGRAVGPAGLAGGGPGAGGAAAGRIPAAAGGRGRPAAVRRPGVGGARSRTGTRAAAAAHARRRA